MSNVLTLEKANVGYIPEILSEIFGYCPPVSQIARQRLSSVCRLWHALVLVTPALWTSLDITCGINVLRPPLPVILTHLQRSGTHPLYFILHVAAGSRHNDSAKSHLPTVLTALTAARQRWYSVQIKLVRMMTQDILDFITLGDAPLLRNIQCDVINVQTLPAGFQQSPPVPLRALLHCSPRLESFQWSSLGSPVRLPLVDTLLTSLSLRMTLSVSECVTLLRLSPHLSSSEFYSFYSDHSPIPRLIHSTLCTLTATGEHFPTLLDALTLPALLNLDLMTRDTVIPFSTQWEIPLSAFLERSKPTLRHLSLVVSHTQSHEPALLRVLALTPHLRSLSLAGFPPHPSPFTAALIRALHPSPPPEAFRCPRLQTLELSGIWDCPDGLCAAMLRARWGDHARANGVACLEGGYITRVLRGGRHDRDQADMMELCADGMPVKLHWKGFGE